MKVSRTWLQNYFERPLPDAAALADALTFHAFEIEEHDADMIDVKVLPNRAADCLSHRGLARELSAILEMPVKIDPLRESLPEFPRSSVLEVQIEDPKKCLRYMGAVVRGVKVAPSPAWLREALESVGQRSINNIVDATNYVMLNIGQPLHAFDAGKLQTRKGKYNIGVRVAGASKEKGFTSLDGRIFPALPADILTIQDLNYDEHLGIAGIKGGKQAEVDANTTDLIIEVANFDGAAVRRAAQKLKLFTDASLRFQNRPSPELVAYGMRDVLALIVEIAGGEVEGVVDEYPMHLSNEPVSATLAQVNGVLGAHYTHDEVAGVFKRLGLDMQTSGDTFMITPPFERTDILLKEDLIEEAGRILGYDRLAPAELPAASAAPDQAKYRGIEKIKDRLIEQGFTEVSTQSFAKRGDVYLANPLDKTKPALRSTLAENMKEALAQAKQYALRVLAPGQKPKLFEIGTIFTNSSAGEGERVVIETSEPVADLPQIQEDNSYEPKHISLGAYQQFSAYPFMTRDIAFWVPSVGTTNSLPAEQIFDEAWQASVHSTDISVKRLFLDRFEKDNKISMAYRLIFESMERTLTDEEVNAIMEKIYASLRFAGYEVR